MSTITFSLMMNLVAAWKRVEHPFRRGASDVFNPCVFGFDLQTRIGRITRFCFIFYSPIDLGPQKIWLALQLDA